MSSNYIIREATDTDYPQIPEIYRYYWDKHFENMPEDYQKVLENLKEAFDKRQGYFNFWVCSNDKGEIYGWLSCLPTFMSPLRKGHNGELSIYIRNDKINKTIGGKLLNEVIKILEDSTLYMLWGHISPNNIPSQKLVTNAGFINTNLLFTNTPYYPEYNLWMKPLKRAIKK